MSIAKSRAIHHFYLLPCCLLLLNLVNAVINYKAGLIGDPLLRTAAVIVLVLFGSSVTAFIVTPALAAGVRWLHQSTRRSAGGVGEVIFFTVLGAVVFWLYYRLTLYGTAAILPPGWRN